MQTKRRALLIACGALAVVGAAALFRPSAVPKIAPQSEPALRFAQALAAGNYEVAHEMLSSTLQARTSACELGVAYRKMIEYGGGPPNEVKVLETLDYWPLRQATDIGWAYVSIGGDGWAEAVTVVVANQDGKPVVRSIEWGRP